ncbi:MAG: accessory factor UbiK family protein [Gammaproteobacteria bacterium]|jgi:hypothetical protein|nr:accessory factor UbiK family protein [Gammaproteobacteria bacterium]
MEKTRPGNVLEDLARLVEGVFPQALAEDLRKNLRGVLRGGLDRAGLVTREELEIQEALLERTRARLRELEIQVAELESRPGPETPG